MDMKICIKSVNPHFYYISHYKLSYRQATWWKERRINRPLLSHSPIEVVTKLLGKKFSLNLHIYLSSVMPYQVILSYHHAHLQFRGGRPSTATTVIAIPKLKQAGLSCTKTGAEIANTVSKMTWLLMIQRRYDYQWLFSSIDRGVFRWSGGVVKYFARTVFSSYLSRSNSLILLLPLQLYAEATMGSTPFMPLLTVAKLYMHTLIIT
jgi:hypothetical protein